MTYPSTNTHSIEPAILEEAADWLTLLHSGESSAENLAQLQRWQLQSSMHEAAWQRAEHLLIGLQQIPAPIVRETLSRVNRIDRRRALKTLALLTMVTPTTWLSYHQLPWQHWQADLSTATGERQSLTLVDGTRLILNTSTAVNITFIDRERRLTLLEGEILIATGKDPSPVHRPFVVDTHHGRLQALGTRFTVRQCHAQTRLAVYEGAVKISAAGLTETPIVQAGEQRRFSHNHIGATKQAHPNATLWTQGMILALDMPLGHLIDELSRYRRGVLRCDPAIAKLQVSGAFPVTDTDASLDLLAQTLPLQINRVTPWWVTVKAT